MTNPGFETDKPTVFLPELQPGEVIRFADMRELVLFEDLLAPLVDPLANVRLWEGRKQLGDILRPSKFYGTIRDITLEVMANPYEKLLDANERGWTFSGSTGNKARTQEGAELIIERYLGFTFDAEAHSSNPSFRGRIGAELWYFPSSHQLVKAGSVVGFNVLKNGEMSPRVLRNDSRKSRGNHTGEAIRRVVTKPHYDRKNFEAAYDNSRSIGFAVLRESMINAVSIPMKD